MVLEEGLDIGSLPETLKEDFKQLEQLEGQFRLTRVLVEPVDFESSPREGPICDFCNVKVQAEEMKEMVEEFKLTKTSSKVILSDIVAVTLLLKVEVGSAMYKKGIRWTVFSEPFDNYEAKLVPDKTLTISTITLMVFKITVMITLWPG